MIEFLHLRNFKSISEVNIACKRINVFIGKPNVGKSNIIDSLNFLHYNSLNGFDSAIINEILRVQNPKHFFRMYDSKNILAIETNDACFYSEMAGDTFKNVSSYYPIWEYLQKEKSNFIDSNIHILAERIKFINDLINNVISGESEGVNFYQKVAFKSKYLKNYIYIQKDFSNDSGITLNSPFGENLPSILISNHKLRTVLREILNEYEMKIVLEQETNKINFQYDLEDSFVVNIPIAAIAETLKRYIFHLAAIYSNSDSILLFEEPEAHCYQPYMINLANEIIKSSTNQFFITTHSPYLINEFAKEANPQDLAIHYCYYQNKETKVKTLSAEEIEDMLIQGSDIFLTINSNENRYLS